MNIFVSIKLKINIKTNLLDLNMKQHDFKKLPIDNDDKKNVINFNNIWFYTSFLIEFYIFFTKINRFFSF